MAVWRCVVGELQLIEWEGLTGFRSCARAGLVSAPSMQRKISLANCIALKKWSHWKSLGGSVRTGINGRLRVAKCQAHLVEWQEGSDRGHNPDLIEATASESPRYAWTSLFTPLCCAAESHGSWRDGSNCYRLSEDGGRRVHCGCLGHRFCGTSGRHTGWSLRGSKLTSGIIESQAG